MTEKSAPGLQTGTGAPNEVISHNLRRTLPPPEIVFEYIGDTALVVTGPITGRRYRFEASGAKLSVDRRDASGFAAIPRLRRTAA